MQNIEEVINYRNKINKNLLNGVKYELTKKEFFNLLNHLYEVNDYRFIFDDTCNDPPISKNGGRTTNFTLDLVINGQILPLVWKGHRKSIIDFRIEIIDKYNKWIEQWKKNKKYGK